MENGMSFSFTVPQLFYDLIARVIPGSVFLFNLRLLFTRAGINISNSQLFPADHAMGIAGNIFVFVILAYFCGWILKFYSFFGYDWYNKKMIAEQHEENKAASFEKFQKIRIMNETAGFRIAKLKAECRMLEATRTGVVFLSIIYGVLTLLDKINIFNTEYNHNDFYNYLLLLIPILIVVALQLSIKPAFNRYIGSINDVHDVLC